MEWTLPGSGVGQLSCSWSVEDTSEKKEQGPDQVRSGKYIVYALRHHFDGEKSVTSMMLIRDSYGLHFTKTS